MIATELRIGNWMMGNKPFQIKANDIGIAYYHEKEKGEPRWQPITLTEACLVSAGFQSIVDKSSLRSLDLFIQGGNVLFYSNNENDFTDICLTTYGLENWNIDDIELCNYNIKYVHQLQNIYFALTQKELEINEN